MELVTSPNPVDEPNLLYKLQRKIKVFKGGELRNRGYNLVASACKYGLVFVADPSSSFAVYYLKQLIDKECASPQHLSMKLPEAPTHLGISCDHELLAVTGVQYMHFYQVKNFQNENNTPLSVRCNIDASTYVSALQWNPCLPDTIAAAFSDGSLLVSQVKDSDVTKKITAKARCLCWSPKGKQLVTGNADGTLCQYKPDLTLVKTIPAPNICDGSPVEVLAIHWISNYQFGVVYRNAADDSRPYVTIVNTPKAGPTVCINYEDICYSLESFRPWYYYLISIAPWNIIMASSSNSMEIATMGSEDSMNWLQWCQMDEARPELPLSDRKEENYPVGLALDTCAVHQLPWGENETLPHMPLLLVVSHTGLLSLFNIINLRPGAAQVCSPPQPLALCPARLLTSVPEAVESPQKTAPAPAPAPVPTLVSAPAPASVPAPIAPTFSAPPPAYTPTPAAVSVLQNAQTIPSKPAAYAGIAPQAATMSLGQPQTQPKLPEVKQHAHQKSQMSQLPPSQPKPPTDYTAKPAENTTNNAAAVKSKEAQLKAADELRATTVKANEELKAMLLKEVNIFQNEVYKFIQKSRNVNIEFDTNTISEISAKLQQLNAIQLEKDCSVESLKSAIVELKLDLVKTCAILAEAQSRTDSREVQQWSQTDPLSARALESVRRQACLVQARLEEAHRVMRHEWGQLYADTRKGADHMTIPALDAVYQPLVHQQEILTRQQAIIRALQKTQQETSTGSRASMLRMTPFGKDPLSKLTKNILNMSLGPETDDKTNGLDAQKLDRLRDLLSNHKTVRIKPVNMDVRRHLASMQESHDKLVQEMNEQKLKKEPKVVVKQDEPKRKVAETRAQAVPQNASSWPPAWLEPATQPIAQPTNTKPGYVNITNNNIATVARNLFGSGDVPKPDIQAVVMPSKPEVKQPELADKKTPTSNANSVLVGLLQNKTNLNTNKNNVPVNKNILETDKGNQDAIKNNANTFMGQKICSPNSVAHSSAPFPAFGTTTKPSFAFAGAKPPSSNLFGSSDTKPFSFSQPQPQTKPQQPTAVKLPEKPSELPKPATDQQKTELAKIMADLKSAETGEAEDKKPEVPIPLVNASKNGESKEAKPGLLGIKPLAEKATDPPKSAELKPLAEKAKPTQLESTGDNKTLAENNVSKPFSFLEAAGQGDGKIASKPTGVIFASPPLPGASGTSIFGGAATSPTNAVPPAPVTSSPAPVTSPPAPLTSPPAPVTSPPAPVTSPPAPATSPPAPVTSTPDSAASIFGSAAATTAKVTPASVFGSASPPTAAAVSPAATVVPQTSPTTPAAGSLFGSAGTATSSATAKPASPAASSVNTTPSATSIFASANAALTTTAPSPFAQASPVGASSIFGSTPASTSATSVFGSVAPAPATPGSIFGAAAKASPSTVFGGTSTSVFGTAAGQPTPQSVFGSPATTAQSSSIFGASEATSLFGAASISTTSAPATGNVFGGSNAGGSIFSNSNTSNVFGAKPAFGQSTTASSIFGGGSSTFGQPQQSGGNIFGAGGVAFGSTFSPQTTQAASIFGGASGGSGFTSGSPGFGSASPTATGSIFGGDSTPKPAASVFGSPQQTPAFGGGAVFGSKPVFGQPTASFGGSPSSGGFSSPFSGGGANVAQSGFGAPPAFGKSPTSGFGAPAAFGGSPSFGGAPSFGSTSPGKVFGGAAPGFGSPPQQTGSSTFENLASQNTLSFGNLAQHSPQPSQPAPTFNTSPSFSGWRG